MASKEEKEEKETKIVIQPGAVLMFRPEFLERLKIEYALGAECGCTQQIIDGGLRFLVDVGRIEKAD